MFVGDSVTYGTTFVDQSQILTSLLARELPEVLHRPTQILNASAGGWAIGNEAGCLRSRGTSDSDWVIFVINSGDIGQPFAPFVPSPNFPAHRPWSAIGEVFTRYVGPRVLGWVVAGDQGRTTPLDPGVDVPHDMQLFGGAKAFIEQHHAHMAVVFTPFQTADFADSHAPAVLTNWASTHRAPLVDLTPDFLRYPIQKLTFDGEHPRPAGDRVIADRLLKELPRLIADAHE